jgi:hypothetical protein
MAEKSGSDEKRVDLRRKIARSRELVVRDVSGLRYELDFPLKIRKAFQRHTVVWIGAALALGLVVSLLRARTKKVYVNAAGKKVRRSDKSLLESGALLGAAKLAMTVLQPIVVSHFAKKGAKKGDHGQRPSRSW